MTGKGQASPGSGRKPVAADGLKRVAMSVSLDAAQVEAAQVAAELWFGGNVSLLIRTALDAYLEGRAADAV